MLNDINTPMHPNDSIGDMKIKEQLKVKNDMIEEKNNKVDSKNIKSLIFDVEKKLLKFPQKKFPLTHRFLDGLYSREIFMPKGSVLTSKTHKVENLTIISKGECLEISGEMGYNRLKAPISFISPPGIKRFLIIIEDTIWTTIHSNPTNSKNVEELEQMIIDSDNEFDNEIKKIIEKGIK